MEYTRPQVTDYGSLLELTADIDVHFVGAMSNLVMAALSSPMGGTGGRETYGGVGGITDSAGDVLARAPAGGTKLPFTGFPAYLLAGAGAALVVIGAAVRSTVRRRPRRT